MSRSSPHLTLVAFVTLHHVSSDPDRLVNSKGSFKFVKRSSFSSSVVLFLKVAEHRSCPLTLSQWRLISGTIKTIPWAGDGGRHYDTQVEKVEKQRGACAVERGWTGDVTAMTSEREG